MEAGHLWFNTQFTIGRAPHFLKLKFLENKILKPAIVINFQTPLYQVKTVTSPEELYQVLKLRFEVFFKEFSTKKVTSAFFPYDVDMFDFKCDHLVVKDKASGEIVACYRLLKSDSAGSFYSETEFDLSAFLELPGKKLELGRACVHKDFRKGVVVSLLWKGLLEYARVAETRFMFGCTSIGRKDFVHVPEILATLKSQGSFIEGFKIDVRPKHRLKFSLVSGAPKDNGKVMNSLMHMYLLAGAKMSEALAYDAQMDCLDIFTLMDLRHLPSAFERRFS